MNWYGNAILNIIKNERYCGDAKLQKTYRPSFKSKLNKVNNNVLPIYYVENNHPPIVSREVFQKANQIRLKKIDKYLNLEKCAYSKKTIYSSLIYCPFCGSNYIHRINNHGTSYSKHMMQCKTNKGKKICESDKISLEVFDSQLLCLINKILDNRTKFLKLYKTHLETDKHRISNKNKQKVLKDRIGCLHSKLEILSSIDDLESKVENSIKRKIANLQSELNNINNILLTQYNIEYQYLRVKQLLTNQKQQIESISDFPFRNLFNKVIVESKDSIKFLIGNRTDFQNFNHKKKGLYKQSTSYTLRDKGLQSKSELHFF